MPAREQTWSQRAADRAALLARRCFRGTWVHRLPFTGAVYTRVMRHAQATPDGILRIAFRGAQFDVPGGDATVVPTLRDGTYERRELDVFLGALRPGMRVVDVGANVGVFTVLSARRVGPGGEVVAFEPFPANAALLRRNLELNGCRAVVHEACVGDGQGVVRLGIVSGQSGTHAVGLDSAEGIDRPLTSLDHEFPEARIDAVKVDVEGFETQVLAGARGLVERNRPLMLIEFAPSVAARVGDIAADLDGLVASAYPTAFFFGARGVTPLRPGDCARLAARQAYGNVLLVPAALAGVVSALARGS